MDARDHSFRAPFPILACALLLLSACSSGSPPTAAPSPSPQDPTKGPAPLGDLALMPFRSMARASVCTDLRNRLFVIDEVMVFWDRAGNCPDFSYEQKLYGDSLDKLFCSVADSIAGPQKKVVLETRRAMFETILANLTKADLGLGAGHTVRPVPI
jgi:hypothetical protein